MNTAPICPAGKPPIGLDLRAYEVAAYPKRNRIAANLIMFALGALSFGLILAMTIVAFSVGR